MQPINLAQKFSLFSDHWSPKIVGELNDSYVKLAKFQGEFVWHNHANEDELFLVVKGSFTMRWMDGAGAEQQAEVREGEFFIVPKGVEHCPSAKEEVHIVLFEPKSTKHTGDVDDARTVKEWEWI